MTYEFIGWCKENNHDKVWGIISLESPGDQYSWSRRKYVVFWGRRGKKLQTKSMTESLENISKLVRSKKKKNYVGIDEDKLSSVYPEFKTDLEKTAVWAILKMSY